jgi:hypothetical protein
VEDRPSEGMPYIEEYEIGDFATGYIPVGNIAVGGCLKRSRLLDDKALTNMFSEHAQDLNYPPETILALSRFMNSTFKLNNK